MPGYDHLNGLKSHRRESSFMEWIIVGGIAILFAGGTIIYRKVLGQSPEAKSTRSPSVGGAERKPATASASPTKAPQATGNAKQPASDVVSAVQYVAASFRMEQCAEGKPVPEEAESIFVDARYWWSGDSAGLETLKADAGLSSVTSASVDGAELLVVVYSLPLDAPLSSRFSGSSRLGDAAKAGKLKVEGMYRSSETGLTDVGFSR